MNSQAIMIVTDIATFMASMAVSAFIAGTRWGRIEADTKAIRDRLGRIEGMFTLKLKDKTDD